MRAETAPPYPTPFCSECDFHLAADLAALPPEYRRKVVDTARRLIEFYARASGVELPSDRTDSPPNVVPLRFSGPENPH